MIERNLHWCCPHTHGNFIPIPLTGMRLSLSYSEKCGKIGHLSKHCTVGKQNLKMSSQLKRLFAMYG